jgi:hypothetical protein
MEQNAMAGRLFPDRHEKFRTAESRQMPEEDPKNTDGTGDDADRGSDIDRQITDNLRKLYQSTVDEELPPSLRDLIDRLKAQDRDNG